MAQKRDVEGMGIPEIKYGESMCFVQHVSTGLWLTYAALDAKAARLGMMKRKVSKKRSKYDVTVQQQTLSYCVFYVYSVIAIITSLLTKVASYEIDREMGNITSNIIMFSLSLGHSAPGGSYG